MNGASTRTRPSDRKEGISQLAHRPCKSDPKRAWRKQNNGLKSVEVREGRKGERGRVRVGMRASERAEERKSDG